MKKTIDKRTNCAYTVYIDIHRSQGTVFEGRDREALVGGADVSQVRRKESMK